MSEEILSKTTFYVQSYSKGVKFSTAPQATKPKKFSKKPKQEVEAKLTRPLVPPLCNNNQNFLEKEKFYITTAINYTNGLPHLGHAYEAICADVIARYHRLAGRDTFFLTGTDEHGQKVQQSAEAAGKTPQQMADFYMEKFKALDKLLNISFDNFIRTTDDYHEDVCRNLWEKVKSKGDIYLKPYEGWYDVHSERYVTDFEAKATDFKDEHGRPYERKSEESYFFKMGKYKDQLLEHIEKNPEFIMPESRKHEILSFLKGDLHDLCVTRTVCQWGVKIPEDPEYKGDQSHVMYVWFDALTNYLSGIGYLSSDKNRTKTDYFWPADLHYIGKDITRFHCIYWPCMLMSAGIPLPKSVVGHGFVNDKNGVKMSKSLGNVVNPVDMVKKYNVDCFRWYLCIEAAQGTDLPFNEEAMVSKFNANLNSGYGNLVHRSTSLCKSMCNSKIPDVECDQVIDFENLKSTFDECFQAKGMFQISKAAEVLLDSINSANKYLQDSAPWAIKGTDEVSILKKQKIVRSALESVYVLAHFVQPFCPNRIDLVFDKLGVEMTTLSKLNSNNNLPPGVETYVGEPLYEVLELGGTAKKEVVKTKQPKEKKPKKKEAPAAATGGFYDIDMRVGVIVDVWYHPDADGLFCEKIDVGEKEPRLIASGLRKHYTLEEMKGRKVIAICNLKAANLKGFKSHGMVLCAATGDKVEFCEPPGESKAGDRVILEGEAQGFVAPEGASPNQVSKKKLFIKIAEKLKTNEQTEGTYDGRRLITPNGVCKAKSLVGAELR